MFSKKISTNIRYLTSFKNYPFSNGTLGLTQGLVSAWFQIVADSNIYRQYCLGFGVTRYVMNTPIMINDDAFGCWIGSLLCVYL